MDQKTLREQQRIWDKKLKESGFEDIEDRNSPREMLKSWHSWTFIHHYNAETFAARQQYYELASHFLNGHKFESATEREVWRLHSEGDSLRKIANEISKQGTAMSKDGALKIIRSLLKAMKA